ncbi:response regulator receiver and ANTAR domain protein [Malonomonas rubra DSM 5091]|uniref:Response regulator receiver and ANTAR domain protein n=1 Tax=Malonomonas rubra DSM 5091 TaxID=1122189 RepID=A0A1M6IMF9_MALRU|nr:response regulator [Malonomonas rubra]SHJ35529.1 response regulator receiver and ANTAR domain protein [Malonomonas rubra DSM 5091]
MEPVTKLRVVIAEDEYLISQDVENTVRRAGYESVGIAANGKQVLELIDETTADIAILDIKMPVMDGLEAARQIRDQFQIPVVMMTAYESPEFLAEAKEAGVGAYLIKPPNVDRLKRAVEISVARHNDLLELRTLNNELVATIAELKAARNEISELREILPICSYCKNVRDDQGFWQRVEKYLETHSSVTTSHGICNDCMQQHFPDIYDRVKNKM